MDKQTYIAPHLTVVTVPCERGYSGSDQALGILQLLWLTNGNNDYREMETFSTHDSWTENSENFWQ